MTFPRVALVLSLLFLISCSDQTSKPRAIGEGYVGPSTLLLRQELTPKSPVSATVKHGDKLEILEFKRRFVRVRTQHGIEGWTDNRLLLTPEQMTALRQMAERASHYPSQGAATVFEALNMHTEPGRSSPSFWQIPENGKVDVIDHKLAPRTQPARSSATVATRPQAPSRRRSKDRSTQSKIPPPAPPPAPKPPENWLDLSVPNEEILGIEKKSGPPQPMDDWSLVRTKEGKVGWVLTRALSMAIPDEVAQYAEGHRITSYFALGNSSEGRPDWLWTTITKGLEPYEFDSFRVFVWSRKHKRYETAYIERNVVGHFPVSVNNSGDVPKFSVILEDISGKLIRKTYTFEGYRVKMVSKETYQPAAVAEAVRKPVAAAPAVPAPKSRSWYASMKDRIRRLFH